MEPYVLKHQKHLRRGITTGTCTAAAAKAAVSLLLLHIPQETIPIHTPKGVIVSVPVILSLETEKKAEYMVIKDSGDDPDVTNHAQIYASVEKADNTARFGDTVFRDERYPSLFLDGGTGIGRVTRDGLEQKAGQAAINAVPRSMIFQAVGEICELAEYKEKLLIIVRVPNGKELAQRTFNPRLGIRDGISILGTSGILEPMSEQAIIDTIETQIRQLQVQGEKNLLVTPGNYGQGYASSYLHLDLEGSIKCSNYIGDTLDLAVSYGMEHFLLIGNIGKLGKLAAGIMNTHSKTADARCEIFAVHTVLCGGNQEMVQAIMACIHTDEILQYLEQWGLLTAVINSLCVKIQDYLQHRAGTHMQAGVILFSEKFGFLGQTACAGNILTKYRLKTQTDKGKRQQKRRS